MKTQKTNVMGILIALSILILSSVACSFSAVDVDKNGATISVSLQENEINSLLEDSTNHIEEKDVILRDITSVDMHEGYLRVFGTYDKAGGSQAEGSYDVAFTTKSGELFAEIIAVDIEGLDMGDQRIQKLNEELADSLAENARKNNGEVEFESVKITDESFNIVVKTHFDNNWDQQ